MYLGQLDICLSVKDLLLSYGFYTKLGFELADGSLEIGYVVLRNGTTRMGLYAHDEPNMLNFRGAELHELARRLQENGLQNVPEPENEGDGSVGFKLTDPDGNVIYFNTLEGHDPAP